MPKVAYHADISAMSGKQGDQVYAESRMGGVRKSRVIPMNPNTPAQAAARKAFGQGSATYSQLGPDNVAQWENYAAGLRVTDPITGRAYAPTAGTVFTGLTSKFLQATPNGAVPLLPPSSRFGGDGITVSAAPGSGGIVFTGSGENGLDIQTELMVQKLPNGNRKPGKGKYRMKGFVGFAPGHLSQTVPLAPGRYACAYKFVYLATGQSSTETPIGVVVVA